MTKQTTKSIATTPVMRAKTSQRAFIAGGHVHDDRYIRYDESESYTNSEINLFLQNLGVYNVSTSKLLRLDISQSNLSVTYKANGRNNIGIVDDIGAADSSGNIRLSDFGNRVGGSPPTGNELTNHFVRYDVSSTLSNSNAATFATNSLVVSRATGLSVQTINSPITITGEFIVSSAVSKLQKGLIVRGTVASDASQTYIRFGNPDLDGTDTVIKITTPVSTTATTALDADDLYISNVKTPTISHQAANKSYVDNQIIALDLPGNYLQLNGENQMLGRLNFGGYRATNLGTPTENADSATKSYVDNGTNISTAISSNSSSGFDESTQTITPSGTGKHLAIVSGSKSSGSAAVFPITITHSGGSTTTRYVNLRDTSTGQWSLTIPITLTTTGAVSVGSTDGNVVYNQLDLVKIGY